ncbi:FecR family protein [Steroidobacter sp.]|uniref:FecR family protein n=1 Tax=Steroidobacter sp. TaxID=1978227 RepID=UPI001A4E14D9|nr:FecR domain-containing protein [Steroidobacter sp.]MBL8271062.1 FecR domain-containing protein [Steroidobacter sp.]
MRQESPSEAARWFARMHDDERTPADEARFDEWLARDPGNERAYQRLEALWGAVESTRNAAPIREARARAVEESQHSAQLSAAAGRRRGGWFIAAAAVVATVGVVAVQVMLPADVVYRTAVGDRRTIQLSDGSQLILNTDTVATVRYRLTSRTVQLERGQAHFDVAHSTLRPFLVDAGRGVIRAIGTRFEVYRQADEVQVKLLEGRIEVTPAAETRRADVAAGTTLSNQPARIEMTAGQQTALSASGMAPLTAVNVPVATAWLDGKLVFNDVRLQEAVAEINRYSTQKIYVLDGGLAEFRVSGVFRTDRADAFISAVSTSLPILVQPAADGAVLLAPAD